METKECAQAETLDSFLLRLQRQKKILSEKDAQLPPSLRTLITKENYLTLLSYFDTPAMKAILSTLKPDTTHRFQKSTTKLPRTLTVLFTDGQYHCILETKSKLATPANTPQCKIPEENRGKNAGKFKKPKKAFRIDFATPMPQISLVFQYDTLPHGTKIETYEAKIKQQLAITKQFNHPNIATYTFGGTYYNNQKTKSVLYGNYADCGDLFTCIDNFGNQLSLREKHGLALGIVQGLKKIHDEGYVHRDIKPENILVFKGPSGYITQITDFDFLIKNTCPVSHHNGTPFYASPEIASVDSNFRLCPGYTAHLFDALQYEEQDAKMHLYFQKPHAKNDMWALGVTLYMLYFREPYALTSQLMARSIGRAASIPLLAKLLEPCRHKRFDVNQALTWLQTEIKRLDNTIMASHRPAPETCSTSLLLKAP